MADVFISYKRIERPRCERIAKKLQGLGLDVWFDARLESGKSFDKEIEDTIAKSKSVLVLWSPGSVESRWVRDEAGFALKKDKLVAATLAPCDLPIAFSSVHFEELHDPNFQDDHPGWLKLVGRIAELVGRPSIVSYCHALAEAAQPLERWARDHPDDPLARQSKAKADVLGGADAKATKPSKRPSSVPMMLAALLSLGVGLIGGYFGGQYLSARPVVAGIENPPQTPEEAAAGVVGVWGPIDQTTNAPNCDNAVAFELWLGSAGETRSLTMTDRSGDAAIMVLSRYALTGVSPEGALQTVGEGTEATTEFNLRRDADGQTTRLEVSGDPNVYGACS